MLILHALLDTGAIGCSCQENAIPKKGTNEISNQDNGDQCAQNNPKKIKTAEIWLNK